VIRVLLFFFTLLSYSLASSYFAVGTTFEYEGKTYRVNYFKDAQCASGGTALSSVQLKTGNVYEAPTDINDGCDTRYYHIYAEIHADLVSDTGCEHNTQGLCYAYTCGNAGDRIDIDGQTYLNTGETDSEICQTNGDGTDTGNIWRSNLDCSAPTGACLREDNCTAPEGFSEITGITDPTECDASRINASLTADTTMAITETIWQSCDSKCYGKTILIDCASQTPYTPTLSEGETIYSTTMTLQQCIDYANNNNMDARHDTYSTHEAPGFSCQNLQFCIIKDRPHNCQGVVTPTPHTADGETYFQVQSSQECTDYGSTHNVSVRTEHYDDRDNAGQSCYDVDYCIALPYVDDNGTTGGDPGGGDSGTTSPLPDNTGTNTGTGVQSIDLNGTNDRLDIIDGHLKDLSQTVREGFDRNHDDLNHLSQDIQDGVTSINRGLNGLSHSISGALDAIANSGDINVTADFDDSRIVEANNNTTRAINSIGSYLGADINVSDLNVTFSEFEPIAKAAEDAIETMNTTLAESNVSKEELTTMIEDEVTQSMTDFEDKSKTMLSDLLDRIFSNPFNPFQPFIDVGSVPSNFGSLHFPVNIDVINYHQDVYISKSQLLGDQSDPNIAKFYEIMKKLALFLAVFFGFLHMIRGVSNV